MTTVYDVPPDRLIRHVAGALDDEPAVEAPEWAAFAKTGTARERPPEEDGWWTVRAASILRKIYLQGPIGVERLRRQYGGADDDGSSPNHGTKGSGSIVRNALQQLEEAGYVETVEGQGRQITADGRSFLDDAAHELAEEATA